MNRLLHLNYEGKKIIKQGLFIPAMDMMKAERIVTNSIYRIIAS